jgi:predicted GNAT family N-acyltransferase
MITYRRITPSDPEYADEKDLRKRVLRLPLGLALSGADLAGEDGQLHLIATDDAGAVVGCVLVAFPDDGTARIRHLAVEESFRGRRIGTGLMDRAERAACERGIRTVRLHARLYARGFYERLGYCAVSDVFTEVTIPHVGMEKTV